MDNTNFSSDPTVQDAPVIKQRNPFKLLTIILFILVVGLATLVGYFLIVGVPSAQTKTESSDVKSYTIDVSTEAIDASQPAEGDDSELPLLTINDLSDKFTNKYLTIDEWDLKIKTKYADLLEYAFLPVDKDENGSTLYAECNEDYLQCDSVLAIRINERYVDVEKQNAKLKAAYGDSAETYTDNPEDRTVAYIYQDNRSLSQSSTTTVRYWDSDAFETEFGNTGTLLFGQPTPAGVEDTGYAICGVELNVTLDSSTPCEDIFLSLYRFDASSTESE